MARIWAKKYSKRIARTTAANPAVRRTMLFLWLFTRWNEFQQLACVAAAELKGLALCGSGFLRRFALNHLRYLGLIHHLHAMTPLNQPAGRSTAANARFDDHVTHGNPLTITINVTLL